MTYPQQQFPPPGGANPSGQAPYGRSPVQFPAPAPKPWHRRKEQAFVVPLIVVILGGLGTLLGMVIVLFRPVLISMIAVLVFSVVAALGFWFLRWLDRWEPEPPMFLIGAFLWGAGHEGRLDAGNVQPLTNAIQQKRWQKGQHGGHYRNGKQGHKVAHLARKQ